MPVSRRSSPTMSSTSARPKRNARSGSRTWVRPPTDTEAAPPASSRSPASFDPQCVDHTEVDHAPSRRGTGPPSPPGRSPGCEDPAHRSSGRNALLGRERCARGCRGHVGDRDLGSRRGGRGRRRRSIRRLFWFRGLLLWCRRGSGRRRWSSNRDSDLIELPSELGSDRRLSRRPGSHNSARNKSARDRGDPLVDGCPDCTSQQLGDAAVPSLIVARSSTDSVSRSGIEIDVGSTVTSRDCDRSFDLRLLSIIPGGSLAIRFPGVQPGLAPAVGRHPDHVFNRLRIVGLEARRGRSSRSDLSG